jgi:hypothetical protein
MTTPMLQHIPLKSAYLCQDCDSIGNCAVRCPACASEVLLGLSAILDREVVAERRPLAQMPPVQYPRYTAMVA